MNETEMLLRLLILICFAWTGHHAKEFSYTVNPFGVVGGRIVGGEETSIAAYPYVANMEYNGYHRCGGMLLNRGNIVTAAHCVEKTNFALMKFRVGSTSRDTGGHLMQVKECLMHEKYTPGTLEYDVAVCILENLIEYHPDFRSVTLPKYAVDATDGTPCYVAGWGNTLEPGESPLTLRHVGVITVNRAKCQNAYGNLKVTETMMCAGVEGGGKDACQGDSGGPLVINKVLYGIVSWGVGCARPEYPGVYTNVANVEILSFVDRFK